MIKSINISDKEEHQLSIKTFDDKLAILPCNHVVYVSEINDKVIICRHCDREFYKV